MHELKEAKKIPSDKTEELRRRREAARQPAGGEKEKAQRSRGKLLARERIELLLDQDSFEETDLLVESRSEAFGDGRKPAAGDGVVAGVGRINGRPVCVYSQDFTVMGGSLGLAHAEKICKVMDLALTAGCPVIGICDSGGARIQEGVEALGGYAEIFERNVRASGVIPQVSAILGPCAGGAVYSPALTDFVFMVEGISHMFITGPDVVKQATGEEPDFESLGGAKLHSEKSGVCHFTAGSEHDCFRQIRELIDFLPQNAREIPKPPISSDSPRRESALLDAIAASDPRKPYSIREVIREIADGRQFLEIQAAFAKNVVVGFVRLNGQAIGVVANNSEHLSGALDIDASEKAGRFVRFCDAFSIPLLTLVDVPGYWPGLDQESRGIIRRGAKLLYAYCEASVPRVTVILKKAYGGAYDVMNSKHIRGDMSFAWPSAEIAVMGPAAAVEITHRRELKAAVDPKKLRAKLTEDYIRDFASPYHAASRGYVDEVIEARLTRPKLIRAFQFLRTKRTDAIPRKHGNMPL